MANNILIGLLILICINCKPQETVKIYTTNINIETPFRIKSANFESFFQGQIDSVYITQQKDVDNINNQLSCLKMANKSKYGLPDVRFKLIVNKLGQCDTVYGDMCTIVYKGKLLVTTNSLIDLIYKSSQQKNHK